MKHIFVSLLAIGTVIVFNSCGDGNTPSEPMAITIEATANINPNNFPGGIGIDFSIDNNGSLVQLDNEVNFEWDIQVLTYPTAQGGRSGVFLWGDDRNTAVAARAVNVSNMEIATGEAGFTAFTRVTVTMQQALSADGEFLFDPVLDVDAEGRADITILEAAYQDLIIGDRVVNLEEANQPVYLVRDRSGELYKFQMVNYAPGGGTTLRWEKFNKVSIDN